MIDARGAYAREQRSRLRLLRQIGKVNHGHEAASLGENAGGIGVHHANPT